MKEHLSLAELEKFDHRAPRNKTERRFCCPFCGTGKTISQDHRSLAVNTSSGVWICHRCSRNGLLKEYWKELSDKSYDFNKNERSSNFKKRKQVLKQEFFQVNQTLCKPETFPTEGQQKLEKLREKYDCWVEDFAGSEASHYLEGRGIAEAIAGEAGCGYASNWQHWEKVENEGWNLIGTDKRVVFPIRDRQNNLIAVSARAIDGDFLGSKAITVGKKSLGVFSTPNAVGSSRAIIVEAPIDALSLKVIGFDAIAVIGTSWPDWLWLDCAFRRVGIGFDADDAGDIAAKKMVVEFSQSGSVCIRLRPTGGKDWNEVLVTQGILAQQNLLGLV